MRIVPSRVQRRMRSQSGQVLPLVTILLIVILGMAAFAIDISSLYFDQRHLQMQADAAVEAGANEFVQNINNCSSNVPSVEQVEANFAGVSNTYSGSTVTSSPIASNNEAGNVTIKPLVSCGGGSGSYVDATVTNNSPPAFFSGIFGVHPTVSAHARVSLEQVTEEGGSTVLPYAIQQSQAVYNNQLIEIVANDGSSASQSLACDGTVPGANYANLSGNTGGALMESLEEKGCPLTQTNSSGTTCPGTQLSPPSCVWEFSKVSEPDYDAGEVPRFENGTPMGGGQKCVNPYPIPTNNYAKYQANGTIVTGDPRVITIFVVPNGSFTTSGGLIPIVGYAEFYAVGWDHDPCLGTSDPNSPNPGGHAGSLWGYFISYTNPESTNVGTNGTPCNPVASEAWTFNCTYALTQ
jgi:Flp pilus assembly protein TadG